MNGADDRVDLAGIGAVPRRSLLRLTAAVATMGLFAPPGARAAPANGVAGPASGAASGPASSASMADPALPLAEAQSLWARLNGDLSGRTVYYTTMGDVWGFRPQADDLSVDDFAKRAYGYAGVAARRIRRRDDGAIVVRQRSWAFYRDPLSERLTDRITNLWTGDTDTAAPMGGKDSEQVLSAAPSAAGAAVDPYHMHVRTIGAHAFVSTSNMIRFKAGGIDWFKLEGNLASHQCAARDLADATLPHVPNTYTQNLVAEWQTWTHMHGQPGHILFKGDGAPLFDPAEIPDDLRRAIDTFFPGQLDAVAAWG